MSRSFKSFRSLALVIACTLAGAAGCSSEPAAPVPSSETKDKMEPTGGKMEPGKMEPTGGKMEPTGGKMEPTGGKMESGDK